MGTRIERDSMGEMEVPEQALFGASTQRAVLNFPISGAGLPAAFVSALGLIKLASARSNTKLAMLPKDRADAIERAAAEVVSGELLSHFVVDVFQTGSGTSTNMNANEVIANRASELLGKPRGDREAVHPNDHVNMCQSSNDVIPSAIHVAAQLRLEKHLLPALEALKKSFDGCAQRFASVIKAGRTHLQDATPMSLGQEFSGYAAQIAHGIARIRSTQGRLCELALGGTAVGTGLNTHPEFPSKTIAELNKITGMKFSEAANHFEAQGAQDAAVELSGQLRTVAVSMMKIANDLRWLASGPRCNIFEIELPEIQPGSSIMPAKVNPVVCESTMMVCAQVMGNDTCVMVSGQHGNFELNTMLPVIARNVLESIELLGAAAKNLSERCVSGISANEARCLEFAEKSLATCTSLAPKIGYDRAAKVAKQAYLEDKTVRQVAKEMGVLSEEELSRVLNLVAMTKPGL